MCVGYDFSGVQPKLTLFIFYWQYYTHIARTHYYKTIARVRHSNINFKKGSPLVSQRLNINFASLTGKL